MHSMLIGPTVRGPVHCYCCLALTEYLVQSVHYIVVNEQADWMKQLKVDAGVKLVIYSYSAVNVTVDFLLWSTHASLADIYAELLPWHKEVHLEGGWVGNTSRTCSLKKVCLFWAFLFPSNSKYSWLSSWDLFATHCHGPYRAILLYLHVWAMTFELNVLWPRHLAFWFTFALFG